MNIQILIEYKGKIHKSKEIEGVNEKEIKEYENLILDSLEGKINVFTIDTQLGSKHFPLKVLKKCIISIQRYNN